MESNLTHALAYRRKWLPVERIFSVLHAIDLEPGFTSRALWKGTQIVRRSSQELNGFDLTTYGLNIQ